MSACAVVILALTLVEAPTQIPVGHVAYLDPSRPRAGARAFGAIIPLKPSESFIFRRL